VGKVELLDSVGEGAVGGTYYGNPVACAAALVVMDYFDCLETLEHV
jgi:4-aminobutyrate aminotransferase-like enzyme